MVRWFVLTLALLLVASSQVVAQDVDSLIKSIRSVGNEGAGNAAAAKAVQVLGAQSATRIPDLLNAFDGASPLAANYLRSTIEAIADRHLGPKADQATRKKLPTEQLEGFIHDPKKDPRARRLAFEILVRVDATAGDRIIPKMLLDPSPEFRRDAVERLIAQAEKADEKDVTTLYQQALSGATDSDQVKAISEALKKRNLEVDLQKHFGFLTQWQIIGPFDNVGFVGFEKSYAPEEKLDFEATLAGQKGDVSWGTIDTEDEFGIVDIAKSVAPHKGAVMYLSTAFVSEKQQDLQLRFGTPNAWKIWVNGKMIFGRDEYHRGMAIDQYSVNATFKPGKNVILVKLCQNEQKDDWAQRYQIQIRVCDASGVAVLPAANAVGAVQSPTTKSAPAATRPATQNQAVAGKESK